MNHDSQIRLSIVVPFYKTEAYLPRCLDSLLAQTLSNIEIICVNDGSPDRCLELLRTYESNNPGVVRVVNKSNGGLWAARWSGTDIARGEYIAYVDSDDYVEPSFAEDLWRTAHDEDADIVVCGYSRIEESTRKTLSTELSHAKPSFLAHVEPGRLIEINPAAWNKCFRRALLLRMHRLSEPPAILEDVTLSQLAYLSSNKPIAFTGTAPYRYMIREGSMINTVTVAQVDSVRRALAEVASYYDSDNAEPALRKSLDAAAFLHLGISMAFRLSCSRDVKLNDQLRITNEYLDALFSTWRNSPYISFSYAHVNGGAYIKLFLASLVYKAHLMIPALKAYRFLIEHFNKEIKW